MIVKLISFIYIYILVYIFFIKCTIHWREFRFELEFALYLLSFKGQFSPYSRVSRIYGELIYFLLCSLYWRRFIFSECLVTRTDSTKFSLNLDSSYIIIRSCLSYLLPQEAHMPVTFSLMNFNVVGMFMT